MRTTTNKRIWKSVAVVAALLVGAISAEAQSKPSASALTPETNLLSAGRIAALPPEQRTAWQQYLKRSDARYRADKAAMEAELKANGLDLPIAAPAGPTFKVESIKSPAWFASDAARRMADAAVSFQMPSGGWAKGLGLDKGSRRPGMHWAPHSDNEYHVGTIDNNATTGQLELLARVHQATGDKKYAVSFLKGLDYLLEAQLPNGGWPQFYPLKGGYHDAITYNDWAMVDVLDMLRDVASGQPEFAFVDEAHRSKAREAIAAGVRCILRTQVMQNGRRTVWCAQHDPLTLAPTIGRAYELPSLSGAESQGIVGFLMSIESPTPEIVQAVQAAVAWFDANKITGVEVVKKPDPNMSRGFDTVVVPNPNAPPIWARFYELGTNRPIFVDRDGVIKYNLADIGDERRSGYAWYITKPRDLLEKDFPAWQAKWAPSVKP